MISPIAGHPGFEPGTLELTALCSAVELMAKVTPRRTGSGCQATTLEFT